MGNGASGAAELLVDTDDASELRTLCGKLEDMIEDEPACLRCCRPILEKTLPDDDDIQGWITRRKELHDAACAFVAILQAAGGSAPGSVEELVDAQLSAGTNMNLSAADRNDEGVVGMLFACNLGKIDTVPEKILTPASASLTVLSLKKNNIREIPQGLGNLVNLIELDVSENSLEALPEDICKLSALQTLNVSENGLAALPEDFGALANLETLSAFKNQLTQLPDSISGCVKLSEVNFFNNKLIKVPASMADLENLIDLNLGGNKIKSLPSTRKWAVLERLALSWNSIVMLQDFGGMPKLRQLQLNRNQLETLPDDAFEGCEELESVDVSTNRFAELPVSLYACSSVQTIDATSNALATLGDFSAMKDLRILKLGSNKLQDIAAANLGACEALETLFLLDNQLTKLPGDLVNLKNLSRMNVATNAALDRTDEETAKVVATLSAQCAQLKGRWIE